MALCFRALPCSTNLCDSLNLEFEEKVQMVAIPLWSTFITEQYPKVGLNPGTCPSLVENLY